MAAENESNVFVVKKAPRKQKCYLPNYEYLLIGAVFPYKLSEVHKTLNGQEWKKNSQVWSHESHRFENWLFVCTQITNVRK